MTARLLADVTGFSTLIPIEADEPDALPHVSTHLAEKRRQSRAEMRNRIVV